MTDNSPTEHVLYSFFFLLQNLLILINSLYETPLGNVTSLVGEQRIRTPNLVYGTVLRIEKRVSDCGVLQSRYCDCPENPSTSPTTAAVSDKSAAETCP